ncbi:Eco57I restriction-modification methylase domain-containing protein, partial [Falsiporphyromonas endometrii]
MVKTFNYKLIYIFRINDKAHEDCLKIGEATYEGDADYMSLLPNSRELNQAAKKRINQYTQTAAIAYELLHTEIAAFAMDKSLATFNDKDVHEVLLRSGIKKKVFDQVNNANEWFVVDLQTAKNAIQAVKKGQSSLGPDMISQGQNPIVFRPEQREAIDKTLKIFKRGKQMLWFAKMRFGKTLSALQVVREMKLSKVLILTHRPVVDDGWFEDFQKIFFDLPQYHYGSKNKGEIYDHLLSGGKTKDWKYIYFASMQDLRGSELVGGNFDKNDEVFKNDWELIIVDEAHEGVNTELGKNVLDELTKDDTKVLELSGTPFNLLDDYKEKEIYTWDYVMEQKAKKEWDKLHPGDPNPYAGLPTMNIYTYDLGRLMSIYTDEEVAFNFREFFRVDENEEFIHKKDIESFLNLLSLNSDNNYPFTTQDNRDNFRHSFWVIPGVKEGRALSALLKNHPVFSNYEIVNVAGEGDKDDEYKANQKALEMVRKAITDSPEKTKTITLSCGRLTTGVSVKEWTAVLMLSGSYSTSASSYMQTIFRVQTPANIGGKMKTDAFVFDFAPDRTLKVLAETAKVSAKAGKTNDEDREILGQFLNFCPVIGIEGSEMKKYDTDKMLKQLKRVYIEKVVRNGFQDTYLYNDELMKLNDLELKDFDELKKIVGSVKANHKVGNIDINKQGLTNEEYEEHNKLEKKKKKKGLTPEEKKRLNELKKKKGNRLKAISILRAISIRMPLMIYGAELSQEDKEITIDNFTQLIDPQSWEEFMPKGVSKQRFNAFKKYYDRDIFSAAAKRIRNLAKDADKLPIEERIQRITDIFATFRNPDKETVLTPWRVVNMHLGDTIGGYNFFEEKYENEIEEPRFIEHREVTEDIFQPNARVLEINSKSGLYPLYMAYTMYRVRAKDQIYSPTTLQEHLEIWDKVIEDNIFVICKTPMAKSITKRTLIGFRKGVKVNAHAFDDLINQITNKKDKFVKQVTSGTYWKKKDIINMNFKAVVGNPPYQIMDGGAGASAMPLYNKFFDISKQLSPQYIAMIMPSRWFSGGRGLDSFRMSMLSDKRIKVLHDYVDSRVCFSNVEIKGGVCYLLWDRGWNDVCKVYSHDFDETTESDRFLKEKGKDIFIRNNIMRGILEKVITTKSFHSIYDYVSSMKPYGLRGDFFKSPQKYKLPPISKTKNLNDITIWGLGENQKREKRYVSKDYPIPKRDGLGLCQNSIWRSPFCFLKKVSTFSILSLFHVINNSYLYGIQIV